MGNPAIEQTFREVMIAEPHPATSPYDQASREFIFGIWARPGLSRRDRRWVTLACVGAADTPKPIEAHAYAALKSGDIALDELLEFVLHFAVYSGWPKASHVEGYVRKAWARVQQERGEKPAPWPFLEIETLGESDWQKRLERGAQEFVDVNGVPAPNPDSPYMQAILSFVFGHVWQRPGLDRRDRRIITVACVAIADAPIPLQSHVTAALHSGDITKQEMDELALQFSIYYGFAKGEALQATADAAWATRPGQ